MAAPPPTRIRWTEAHDRLRHQLEDFRWPLEDLRWLQTHIRDAPPALEALIRAKIAQAKKEASSKAIVFTSG